MKKITLLLLVLFTSLAGFSQVGQTEGFELSPSPTGVPGFWSLDTGTWAIFDNPPGTTVEAWQTDTNNFYQGLASASVGREQIGIGNTSEDYLATPMVSIPSTGSPELHFWTRTLTAGNNGTIFRVKWAPANDPDNQINPNAYLNLQQWNELDLIQPTTNFNVWTEKTVDLSSLAGQDVYLVFVREFTQQTAAPDGDSWLIDNVRIDSQCLRSVPTGTITTTSTTATISWTNPSGATQWEVTVTPIVGGVPLPVYIVNGPTPTYTITTGLTPNTQYNYTVKAICGSGFSSPASVVSPIFTTQVAPPVCGGNLVDSGGINGNYPNNANSTVTVCPVTAGDLVTVAFTAFNTEAGADILRIYDGNNASATLLASLSGATIPGSYTSTAVTGCLTFVFTSNASTTAAGYAANITCNAPPACRIPTQLTSSGITTTTATLNWTQPANADSSVASTWDIIVLPCGSPAPNAGATPTVNDVSTPLPIPPYVLEGLSSGTCYDVYIRAVCGATNSGWSPVPTNVITLVAPPVCGGNYVDSGGFSGNYGNNQNLTTVICPDNIGDAVTVTFTSFNTQAGSDILRVYDGDTTGATLLASLSGTTLPPAFTSTAANGCLTFNFTSNGSTVAPGWLANVVCAPKPPCPTPTVLTSGTPTFNSVPLTWIQSANPTTATAWQVIALPTGSPAPGANPTTGILLNAATNTGFVFTGLASNTCYDFYVRAVCDASNSSAWNNLPVRNVCTTPAPPICGGNFLDPGVNADYTDNLNSVVTICPTDTTQVVTVTFTSFNTEANWDGLYVFDGNTVNAPLIASQNGPGNGNLTVPGAYWGTAIPGPFTSSSADGCLTFRFITDGSGVRAGWVSDITCGPPPPCRKPSAFAVTPNSVTHNSVNLNWTQPVNPDTSIASTWQIYALPCGSPAPTATTPTTTPGLVTVTSAAPAPPYTLTGLDSTTCYDIYIRAVCSETATSDWSGPRTITTLVAPPVCNGFFTDAGGPNAPYANTSNVTTVICPNGNTDVVTVTFTSFDTEATWDALYVYDGNGVVPATQLSSGGPAGNVPGNLAGGYWGNLNAPGATLPGPFTSTDITGCLTFVFRSDGGGTRDGWVANVTCSPAPNCQKPTALYANTITSTSAYLGWTEPSTAVTQWEVYYVLTGSPAPLPTSTGTIVSINPALFTGLNPGTQYTFYVRSVCPTSGTSAWSTGFTFTTLIINDDCSGAIFVPVNQSAICQQTVAGTLTAATASTPGIAPCVGTADDDVWFQFVASNPYLNVALLDITGTTANLNFAVYSGVCGTLTRIFCSAAGNTDGVVNNLTIGQTYFVRVYSNPSGAQTVNFDLCISTPSSCVTGQAACQNLTYQNTTGVDSQGTIGCLGSSPNPTYYTINVTTTGPINLLLTQSTTQGGAPNLDVDYAAWGPYPDQNAACIAIGNPPTLAPGIGVPVTQTTGCSFSAAPTENLNIANAVAGQVYVILITNFSDDPGFISLTQTNTGAAGAGVYECCPDAYFTYNPVVYCKYPGAPNPIPTTNTGSVAGVFSLSPASPTGLVFANTATGEVDLAASAPGNYLVLNTVAANASCSQKQRGYNISIVAPTVATIAYSAPTYCKSITSATVTQTGTPNGVYSVTPNGGLFINVATGAINPSLSSPGVYTIIYSIPGTGVCSLGNPTAQVEILAAPVLTQNSVTACDTFTLPALPVGNYYTAAGGPGGSGTLIDSSIPFTTPGVQPVFIYAEGTNGCVTERQFDVTINAVPTPTYTVTQSSCTTASGSITVTAPTSVNPLPTNLFISEVTDADSGSLTYVELYNATGAPVSLANYKLKFYTWGTSSTTGTLSCDLTLSGTIANNATNVIKVSTSANITGIVPNQSFTGCGGVNDNDNIRLTTTSGTEVDVWGRIDGVSYTPANQPGYTYRRLNSGTIPSTTWIPANWTAIDPEDYTNVGSYSFATSGYQYSIDNGTTYQSGTLFSNLAPGTYNLVVRDITTGCVSAPIQIVIDAANAIPTVATIGYTTPVCELSATNPLPDTSAPGFTTGGTYSVFPTTTTGLALNPSTGEIDLNLTTPGTYTIHYDVAFNPVTCQAAGTGSATIVINAAQPAEVGFTYTTPICPVAQATLAPTVATGFVLGGTFTINPSTGVTINPSTGELTLGASVTAGTYEVTYSVGQDIATCTDATTSTPVQVVITPVTNANVTFSYASPVCSIAQASITPTLDPAITTGGTFTANPSTGITIDASTGVISLANNATTPGTYSITYSVPLNLTTCQALTTSTPVQVVITPATTPLVGFHYDTPVCDGVTANPMPILDAGFVTGGVFAPATIVNAATGEVNLSALTAGQLYTVTYSIAQNTTTCINAANSSATITKSLPILVELNGGCQNVYILNAAPISGSFNPETAGYLWENAAGDDLATTQSFNVPVAGFYTVTVTVDGCSTKSAPFEVTSVSCQIQRGISVNNDGFNDTFDLTGFDVKKLTIFNRYGMEVYSRTNYVNEWGGNSDKGDELPDGTYFYVLDKNTGNTVTGWVYINRAQ